MLLPRLTGHESTRAIGLALVLQAGQVCSLMAVHAILPKCSDILSALERPTKHHSKCRSTPLISLMPLWSMITTMVPVVNADIDFWLIVG